jgi:inner membrane protein
LRPFRDFARYPYLYRVEQREDERCVWFSDLRYDWPALPASFRYGLCHRADGDWRLYRMRYLSEWRQRL